MKTIGILEANNALPGLVDQVRAGEEILLTKHGKPVAKLMPVVEETTVPSMDWLAVSCAKRFAASNEN